MGILELLGMLFIATPFMAVYWCCCPSGPPPCAFCAEPEPFAIFIEFAVPGNQAGKDCDDCEDYDNATSGNTYALDYIGNCFWQGAGECDHTLRLTIGVAPLVRFWELHVEDASLNDIAVFTGPNGDSPLDCESDELGIGVDGGHDVNECDWAGATCDILPQ